MKELFLDAKRQRTVLVLLNPSVSMSMNNVISLHQARILKKEQEAELTYRAKILSMDKLSLLEEMVKFQEARSKNGKLTLQMMVQGKYLFQELEHQADTQELKILARSYRRHLDHELDHYKKSNLQ
jgi:hypothetical protein